MHVRRTTETVVLAVLVTLGAAACTGGGSDVATGTPSTSVPTTSAPSPTPTETSSPSETGSPSASGSPSPAAEIEDGRHFVFVKRADGPDIVFDLAEFYTGDEANQIAGERGDEVPVPNDVYIVNDNPKLRTVAVAPDARFLVYDWKHCCDQHTRVTYDEFVHALKHPSKYHGTLSPYWITVRDGEIVKIEEQYLP